jgi:poly-gamma-glutamate system protein
MIIIRAKSNIVLGFLSFLALMALIAVEYSKTNVKQDWYNEKIAAAELSEKAAYYIKEYRLNKGVFIDNVNDPNNTALIGQEFSLITTDRGNIEAKLTSTNPNFAAVIVQLLKDAGLKKYDNVTVAMTGSFPAMNISVLAAIEVLKLNPIIISSVGASNWGANDPYFTWLDMENMLYKAGIFHNRSIAASIGGGNDRGRGLSPKGRTLIKKAIKRNNIEFINEEFLESSINKRLNIYNKYSNNNIKAYINVGGGIASLGNTVNGKIIPTGLTTDLSMKNFPAHGVIIQMGKKGIPIIHLLSINNLAHKYGLGKSPVPLPEPGTGEIFTQKKYSITVTLIAVIILIIVILIIYINESKIHKLGSMITGADNNSNSNLINLKDTVSKQINSKIIKFKPKKYS